jgi:hypothetical protein
VSTINERRKRRYRVPKRRIPSKSDVTVVKNHLEYLIKCKVKQIEPILREDEFRNFCTTETHLVIDLSAQNNTSLKIFTQVDSLPQYQMLSQSFWVVTLWVVTSCSFVYVFSPSRRKLSPPSPGTSILKVEVICFCEMVLTSFKTARRSNPDCAQSTLSPP